MPLTLEHFFRPKQTKPIVQPTKTESKKRALVESPPTNPNQTTKPKKVRFQNDDEQEFIDFFRSVAKHPLSRGKRVLSRRVAVFGKKYHWDDDVTHKENAIPTSFREWCADKCYTDYNSVLVNVYDKEESHIGWHYDDVQRADNPEVISVSFALNRKHRRHELAFLDFRWPSKEDPSKKTIKKVPLTHGIVIRFNAAKHKKKQCEHRVAKTAFPRVNITLRNLH